VLVSLYGLINQAAKITDSVIVYFSSGKDSLVLLDLCHKKFKRVSVWFFYLIKDLEFQENYLRFIEKKYGLEINRIPHWNLSRVLAKSVYRPVDNVSKTISRLSINDIDFYTRDISGFEWIASGEKAGDSIVRYAMLKKCKGIDEKRKRFFPLTIWNDAAIWRYIKTEHIPLPPDYRMFGRSFGRMWEDELSAIKKNYPNDYLKILEVFPYAESAIKRKEFASNQVSKI
jgi:phosphoadenosine phosphosulfate reductase